MRMHRFLQHQSRQAALCGLLAALSVVILSLGSMIPLATFACPMLAMVCLLPAAGSCGPGPSLLVYAAVSALALLLCPDKEPACFYLFLGWYPSLRPWLERLPRLLRIPVKCGLFTAAVTAMYTLLLFLFRMEAVIAEFASYSVLALTGLLLLGNVTFLLFDRALGTLAEVFRRRRR